MGWIVNITTRTLYSQEWPGTHYTVGWVGLRAGLDGAENLAPPQEFDPRTVQPVASCYTDYAIPARFNTIVYSIFYKL
jgi:hypothetical protein